MTHGRLADAVLVLGCLLFILSLGQFLPRKTKSASIERTIITGLTERDLAIAEAIKNEDNNYSFTTKFIPGIGIIDPPIYLESLKASLNTSEED